ncbi:MAG: hypothetical protein ACT4PE_12415 [Candidatus Eiseniibacteriota bacterium]
MTRSDFAAGTALALAVALFFAPALFGDRAVFTWNMDVWYPWAATASESDLARPTRHADCARQFAVMRALTTEALNEGRLPLWNPWILCGTPLLANFQPAVFYPPNLLLAVTGLSLPDQMTAYLALHVLLGMAGTYALLRRYRVRPLAALAGGIVFGWSGFNAARTGQPTLVASAAWLPWALAASRGWFDRGDARSWAGMAATLTLSGLAGFAQIFVLAAYAFGLFGLVDGLASPRRSDVGRWFGWVSAGGLALLLLSVHLVPTLEFMSLAQDAEYPAEDLASGTLHPWALAQLVVPHLLGPPLVGANAAHLLSVAGGYYFQTEHSTAVYVGALPLLLPAVLLLSPGDRRRETLAALLLAGLGLLFCLWTPLTALALHLPGLAVSRPDRGTFLWCTGMALVTGLAADRLASAEGPGLRRWANTLAVFAGTCAALVAATLSVAGPRLMPPMVVAHLGEPAVRAAAVQALASFAVALAILFLRARGTIGSRTFLLATLAFVLADVGRHASVFNVMQPESSIFRPAQPGGSLEFLRARRDDEGPFRIMAYEPRRSPFGGVLPPSVGAVYDVEDVRGFDSINTAAIREVLEAIDPGIIVERRGNFRGVTEAAAFALPLLDLLNVRYVLAERSAGALPGLEAVHASDLAVHRNPGALPRAFLVGEVRVVEEPAALLAAMAAPSFRPDLWAYSAVPIDGPEPLGGVSPGTARVLRHLPERVAVEVQADRPALLVLADSWYPGWKASVAGRERPIHRVDHIFRGVVVGPEDREVNFEYRPASFRLGAALSLAGLALLALGSWLVSRTAGCGSTPPAAR